MINRIRNLIKSPVFPQDEEKTRQAAVLHLFLLGGFVILILNLTIAVPFIFAEKFFNVLAALALLGVIGLATWLMRRGQVRAASILLVSSLWVVITLFMVFSGGVKSEAAVIYVAGTVIAGLLLGWREALIYGIVCGLVALAMVFYETFVQPLPVIFPVTLFAGWVDLLTALCLSIIALYIVLRSLNTALRESQQRYYNLSSLMLEGIAIIDKDHILEANPQLAFMLDYSIDEMTGMYTLDLVAPQSRELALHHLIHNIDDPCECLALRKDGLTFPVEIRFRMMTHQGRLVRVVILRDISERKRADEASARQVERLRALNNIEQAILSSINLNMILSLLVREVVTQLHVDAACVLLANPQSQTLDFAAGEGFLTQALLYTRLEVGAGLAGRAAQELKTVHIANLAAIDNSVLLQSIAGEKFVTYFGVPLIAKGQLHGVLELFHRAPLAPDPEWLAVLETLASQAAISIENASLFETTQQSLKETNALYQISQRLTGSLDPDQLIKDVVEMLYKDFGFYHVQYFQVDWEDSLLVAGHGSGKIGELLREQGYHLPLGTGITGHVADIGEPFTTNDVNKVIFYVSNPLLPDTQSEMALPIKINDRVIGVLDIQQTRPHDLTIRQMHLLEAIADQLAAALQTANLYAKLQDSLGKEKSMRAQLIQSDRLALVGQLLASVSHELNNPIQAIQNALFLIKEDEPLSDQGRQDLDIVLSETGRMASLLERLSATYRPTHSEDFKEVNLNSLVESVQTLTATHMRHNNITFEFHADPALPVIYGIPEQLRQVTLNLVMNAIEEMRDGGRITVKTERVPHQKKVLLTFSDSGPGIDSKLLPHIFEPFITSKEKGTGLGLTITYDIIRQHNGEIQAENNPQGGATFKVWLPVRRKG